MPYVWDPVGLLCCLPALIGIIMDANLSKKFKILSFVSIIMIVYLHSYNLTINFFNDTRIIAQFDVNSFVQEFVTNGITRIAVPLFFLISGYLFFNNFKPTLKNFGSKYKKRLFSLVLPFLFWSVWGLLFVYILQLMPISRIFFANELIRNYSFKKILAAIFLNPIPHQLWFIRELIKFVIISPIIYFCVSRFSYYLIFAFIAFWLCNFNLVFTGCMVLLFYMTGAYFAIKEVDLNSYDGKYTELVRALPVMWAIILFIMTYLNLNGLSDLSSSYKLSEVSIIVGLLTVWFNYDIFTRNKWVEEKIVYLSSYTFFIFAFHEPLLTIFKKIVLRFLGISAFANLFAYLFVPIVTIIFSIEIGVLLEKYATRFYEFITGGRMRAIT